MNLLYFKKKKGFWLVTQRAEPGEDGVGRAGVSVLCKVQPPLLSAQIQRKGDLVLTEQLPWK